MKTAGHCPGALSCGALSADGRATLYRKMKVQAPSRVMGPDAKSYCLIAVIGRAPEPPPTNDAPNGRNAFTTILSGRTLTRPLPVGGRGVQIVSSMIASAFVPPPVPLPTIGRGRAAFVRRAGEGPTEKFDVLHRRMTHSTMTLRA